MESGEWKGENGKWEVGSAKQKVVIAYEELLRPPTEHALVAAGRFAVLGRDVHGVAGGGEGLERERGFGGVMAVVGHEEDY